MVCTVVCRYLAQIGFQRGIHNIQQLAPSTSKFIARYTLLIAVGIQNKLVCSEVYTAYSRHLEQIGLQRGIHCLQQSASSTSRFVARYTQLTVGTFIHIVRSRNSKDNAKIQISIDIIDAAVNISRYFCIIFACCERGRRQLSLEQSDITDQQTEGSIFGGGWEWRLCLIVGTLKK